MSKDPYIREYLNFLNEGLEELVVKNTNQKTPPLNGAVACKECCYINRYNKLNITKDSVKIKEDKIKSYVDGVAYKGSVDKHIVIDLCKSVLSDMKRNSDIEKDSISINKKNLLFKCHHCNSDIDISKVYKEDYSLHIINRNKIMSESSFNCINESMDYRSLVSAKRLEDSLYIDKLIIDYKKSTISLYLLPMVISDNGSISVIDSYSIIYSIELKDLFNISMSVSVVNNGNLLYSGSCDWLEYERGICGFFDKFLVEKGLIGFGFSRDQVDFFMQHYLFNEDNLNCVLSDIAYFSRFKNRPLSLFTISLLLDKYLSNREKNEDILNRSLLDIVKFSTEQYRLNITHKGIEDSPYFQEVFLNLTALKLRELIDRSLQDNLSASDSIRIMEMIYFGVLSDNFKPKMPNYKLIKESKLLYMDGYDLFWYIYEYNVNSKLRESIYLISSMDPSLYKDLLKYPHSLFLNQFLFYYNDVNRRRILMKKFDYLVNSLLLSLYLNKSYLKQSLKYIYKDSRVSLEDDFKINPFNILSLPRVSHLELSMLKVFIEDSIQRRGVKDTSLYNESRITSKSLLFFNNYLKSILDDIDLYIPSVSPLVACVNIAYYYIYKSKEAIDDILDFENYFSFDIDDYLTKLIKDNDVKGIFFELDDVRSNLLNSNFLTVYNYRDDLPLSDVILVDQEPFLIRLVKDEDELYSLGLKSDDILPSHYHGRGFHCRTYEVAC